MTTESTFKAPELTSEMFEGYSAQFDALSKAINDAGFPVLMTCTILREVNDENDLAVATMHSVQDMNGYNAIRTLATTAAEVLMSGVVSHLKEGDSSPESQIATLIPLTKGLSDTFISLFTQALTNSTTRALKSTSASTEVIAKALISALRSAALNKCPEGNA